MTMTKARYQKRMKQHSETFQKLWNKMAQETNQFIEDNPDIGMYSLQDIERISDSLAMRGAWIIDRINGKLPRDRGSLTKKIRKALGYTYH